MGSGFPRWASGWRAGAAILQSSFPVLQVGARDKWEPEINGNALWHRVGASGEAGSEVLCHFGLRNGVFPREVSCHEQKLIQRELRDASRDLWASQGQW